MFRRTQWFAEVCVIGRNMRLGQGITGATQRLQLFSRRFHFMLHLMHRMHNPHGISIA